MPATNQFLRRATDRGHGQGRAGRRFTDNHSYRSLGRSLRRSFDTMPWFEVWAVIIHTTLIVLHGIIVIVAAIQH